MPGRSSFGDGRGSKVTWLRDQARALAWRVGRRLYCWAREEPPNDPSTNGEYWLLAEVLRRSGAGSALLDIGANVGAWSLHALELAAASHKPIRLIAFEPCSETRHILQQQLRARASAEVVPLAMSSKVGEADFFGTGTAGTNSLHPISGAGCERVRLATLDSFCSERDLRHVAMAKIDAEGFDLDVLHGGSRLLAEGRIDVVQFEYNWRWLLNRASLLEVFRLISDKPYRVGKLTRGSLVFHDKWHFELDRYFEVNYVLVRRGCELEAIGRTARFDARNVSIAADLGGRT